MPGRYPPSPAPLIGVLVCCFVVAFSGEALADPGDAFFEKKIRPILANHCYSCHGTDNQRAGLRLDSRANMLTGGDSGPVIIPGKPDESLLIAVIRYDGDIRMPKQNKLSDPEIADLTEWVRLGAPWPGGDAPAADNDSENEFDLLARARHWSFQPIRSPTLPSVSDPSWALSPMDVFVQSRLEADGNPLPVECDRRMWLRRVTFDLIGLPPAREEIQQYLADTDPDANERVVDRLLASPHHGERWARHWFDLTRFAETAGHEFDFEIPDAWRYRDYVIRALNADVPYDQFVIEHVAGDLLPEPRFDPHEGINESILGTGFWFLGEGKHSPVDIRGDEADRIENQIDVFSRTFLGLSVACARCHDHKFDPITQADYYALCGFLQSSRYQRAFIDEPTQLRERLAELRSERERLHHIVNDGDRPPLQSDSSPEPSPLPAPETRFDGQDFGDWVATGHAFGDGPTTHPEPIFSDDPKQPIRHYLAAGIADSGRVSHRLQGALRSPTFPIEQRYILYRVAGRDCKIRVIIDGFQLIRNPIYGGLEIEVKHGDEFRWVVMDLDMWRGHMAYVEFLDDGDGFIAVDAVAVGETRQGPELPSATLPAQVPTLTGENAARFRKSFARMIELEAALPRPRRAPAMLDGTPENERLHIRGSHKNLGPPVPRRFFEVFDGPEPIVPDSQGSGRLALAHRLVAEDNPLTARVMVNRLMHHHFGEGIVASTDDLGIQGKRPTHPELLDFLADELRRDDWSLKNRHREMVLSRIYRDRSRVRRLEAEAIRDSLLMLSGRLDRRMFGPGPLPHLTPHMVGRGRPQSGPLDGDGRRGVYLNVRRNFLNPMFLAFDYPTPFTTMGRRSVSNVPAQALTLMNNPFVFQQAQRWGQRTEANRERNDAQRVQWMYESAFGRPATPAEQAVGLAFATSHGWDEFAHALVNTKEFIFIP